MATVTITIEGRGERVTEQIEVPDDLMYRTFPDRPQDAASQKALTAFTEAYIEWSRKWHS